MAMHPGRVVFAAAGKWIRKDWEIRGVLALPIEVGDRAREGVGVVLRGEMSRRIGEIGRFGLQTSSNLNTTAHFGALRDQNDQIGPVVKVPVGRHLTTAGVALFALSKAAPGEEYKLFLTSEF